MQNKVFYYTNPTRDRHKARVLQLLIEKETGLKLVNPFYNVDGTPTAEIRAMDRNEKSPVSSGQIVQDDKRLIKTYDGLIGYITNKTSWGSIEESFLAFEVLGKPTYLIFDPDSRGDCEVCGCTNPNNPNHPWPIEHSSRVFGTIEGFIAFAKEKLVSQ